MDNYILPKLNETRFTCPHCGTLASIEWSSCCVVKLNDGQYDIDSRYTNGNFMLHVSTCRACGNYHLWLDDKIIVPRISNLPMPNDDMPEKVKDIYLEARDVFPCSAKAAAALLRLAVQKLCVDLGGTGENINNDIAKLVQQGLPVKIQQALDAIRVIGNNAVHPGTIDLNDNPEMAALLFWFINVIVHDMITQPKKIEALYSLLPQGALDAIQRRDGNNT
jgi:hypothetical protein